MENIKWKTVETITPIYPDGVIMIKEDTEVECPIALVPFPMGTHKEGVKMQRERANLMTAAPELLEKLEKLVEAVEPFDDAVLKEKYESVALAWSDAKKLIERYETGI